MKAKLIIGIVLLLILGGVWYAATGYYSKGERAGTVSKLSEKGYIFKTFEGELNEGGFSGETGSLSRKTWNFSAKDETVVPKLKQALDTGERITLEYNEKFFQFPWNGDTKYFITNVQFLPKPVQPVIEQILTPVQPAPVVAQTPADSLKK